jgi:hypothetical protein
MDRHLTRRIVLLIGYLAGTAMRPEPKPERPVTPNGLTQRRICAGGALHDRAELVWLTPQPSIREGL